MYLVGGTLYRLETDHEDFADMTQQIPADEAFHEETGLLALFESYCHERYAEMHSTTLDVHVLHKYVHD